MSDMKVDGKDLAIIKELEKDSRQHTNLIASRLSLPRVTVHDRIKKLAQSGVVKKFSVSLDYSKLGLPTTAFVLVSYAPGASSQREVAKKIARIAGVYEVFLISGEWDLLVKIRGKSIEDIGKTVLDKIREMPGVAKTLTCACFESVLEE